MNYPDSPFNQMTSPLTIIALTFGSLAYAIWSLSDSPFDTLFYMLVAGMVLAVVEIL